MFILVEGMIIFPIGDSLGSEGVCVWRILKGRLVGFFFFFVGWGVSFISTSHSATMYLTSARI